MNDRGPDRPANHPRPGYFKRRLRSRSKQWVPARIYNRMPLDPESGEILDRSWPLTAEIDGAEAEWRDVWEGFPVEIDLEEWKWLTALRAIAKR